MKRVFITICRFPLVQIAFFVLTSFCATSALATQWHHHVNNMMMHRSKMRASEAELQTLIGAKKESEDPERVKELTTQIRAKYAELEKQAVEFRTEVTHMRFKHPDRGDDNDRKYARFKLKTLREYESSFGLDGQLDRLRIRVSQVYQPKKPEKKINAKPAIPVVEKRAPASTGEERIRLER